MQKLTFVIVTPRFSESLAFYRDLLGMPLLEEWTEFGHGAVLAPMPGAVVELIDSSESAGRPAREPTTFMGLQRRDVDAVHERLTAAGASVNGPPTAKPWGGRGFTAFDPDGMPVNVYSAYSDDE